MAVDFYAMMIFLASLYVFHKEAKILGASYDTILNPFLIFNFGEIFMSW